MKMQTPREKLDSWLSGMGRKICDFEAAKLAVQPAANDSALRLPGWPDIARGAPNAVLRSALFGVIKRGKRLFLQRVPLAAVGAVSVIFTGPRLDQADLDVWLQCLQMSHSTHLGKPICFSVYSFLSSIRRSAGGRDRDWLMCAFARLSSSVVEISDGARTYFGPMILHGTLNEESGSYCIKLNPSIISLFRADGWTQIDSEQRFKLKGQPLAQWLHGFYSTHAAPFPYKVETIYKLCGSEAVLLKHFRSDLRRALSRLEEAVGWRCELGDDDLVTIFKTPTCSQTRHLLRKKLKSRGTAPTKPRDSTDQAAG